MYEELTARPGLTGRLRIIFSSSLALLLGILPLVSIVVFLLAPDLALAFFSPYSERSAAATTLNLRLFATSLFFGSLVFVIARAFALDNFYDIRDRVLRDMLLSGARARDLARVGTELHGLLTSIGPYRARVRALRDTGSAPLEGAE